MSEWVDWPLPAECSCGSKTGTIRTVGGQDILRCDGCDRYVKAVPKHETGRAPRTARRRDDIAPKVRYAVLSRARFRCELCGAQPTDEQPLHASHLLSVDEGLALGWTREQLDRLENLAAFCDACNLGQGRDSLDPVLYLALCRKRMERGA